MKYLLQLIALGLTVFGTLGVIARLMRRLNLSLESESPLDRQRDQRCLWAAAFLVALSHLLR